MKNVFFLLSFAALTSCGKIDLQGQKILGGTIKFDPQALSTTEVQRVNKICNSFDQKQINLGVTTAGTFNFGVSTKQCSETSLTTETQVSTIIDNSGSGYKFRRSDTNALFVFPDVESKTVGTMATICQNTATPMNQIQAANGVVTVFTTVDTEDCVYRGDEVCILITKAVPTGTDFEIVSKEMIKFRVDTSITPANTGFWTYRKLKTNTTCPLGQEIDTVATLKN